MEKKVFVCTFLVLFTLTFCNAQVVESVPLPEPDKAGGVPLMQALSLRKSDRSFSNRELSSQELSNLLWAAYGVNRPDGKRTVPSARDWREFDLYVVTANAWFIYNAENHTLLKMESKDMRANAGRQDFVKKAPLTLIYVADYARMTDADDDLRRFYSATDVGFISQNVYLYCASAGLSTVVLAQIDRDVIRETFKLKPEQYPVLSQTVGYPGE